MSLLSGFAELFMAYKIIDHSKSVLAVRESPTKMLY